MNNAAEFPLWAAILVAFFVLLGASLTLIGTIGFAKLNSFYERLHAPTLGTSWGTGGIVMASIIYFSVSGDRFAFHEIFIGIFMIVTTPVVQRRIRARITIVCNSRWIGPASACVREPWIWRLRQIGCGNRVHAARRP